MGMTCGRFISWVQCCAKNQFNQTCTMFIFFFELSCLLEKKKQLKIACSANTQCEQWKGAVQDDAALIFFF
eukprot:m.60110 g.60110  ORF g.60110 m.60110 type:complete len:71 (-) comp13263_c0_seq1:135-347(-)